MGPCSARACALGRSVSMLVIRALISMFLDTCATPFKLRIVAPLGKQCVRLRHPLTAQNTIRDTAERTTSHRESLHLRGFAAARFNGACHADRAQRVQADLPGRDLARWRSDRY